ncbi:MAG: hypothetical protein WCT33_02900 [Patescibacteria group bacterium]|jgi:hypothetical protein
MSRHFDRIMITMVSGILLLAIFWGIYALIGDVPKISWMRWHSEAGVSLPAMGMESRGWDILFLPLVFSACAFELSRTWQKGSEGNSSYLFASILVCLSAGTLITLATGPCLALMFGAAIGLFAPILAGFEFGRNSMKGFALGTSLGVGLYTGGIVGDVMLVATGAVIVVYAFITNCLVHWWINLHNSPAHLK